MTRADARDGGPGGGLATALRGALGFLTRLPVASDDAAWVAFTETPVAFPLAGYAVGVLVAVPAGGLALAGAPGPAVATAYVVSVYVLTGVHHADGLADLGDAAAVHGDPAARREVLTDTTVGVGALLAVGVMLAALALGALAAAALPAAAAVGLLVAAEVGAKLGMAAVACLGGAAHEGLGSQFTRSAGPAQLSGPVLAALPAAVLTFPSPAALAALLGGLAGALAVLHWSTANLGGVSGDVFGAANELGRVVAVHAGVVAWAVV